MLIGAIVFEEFEMAPYWLSSGTLMIVGFHETTHEELILATLLAINS